MAQNVDFLSKEWPHLAEAAGRAVDGRWAMARSTLELAIRASV